MAREHVAYPRRATHPFRGDARLRNWARNATLGPPGAVCAPETEAQLQEFLASTDGRVRMIGSRMSPGRMMQLTEQGGALLDLSHLTGLVSMTDQTATFAGATTLQEVYDVLSRQGTMLPASPGVIAEQTLAGALATGTHGQGLRQSTIADAALMIRMVLADGSVQEFDRDHPWFAAVQLGVGSLGVITQVTLRIQASPIYTCVKAAASADDLEHDLETWNRGNPLVKAWWFPQEGQAQVWAADEATDDEAERYVAGGREPLEHEGSSDSMNSIIEQTLVHMAEDTKILDLDDKPFRTVTRFKDFAMSPATSTSCSAGGSPLRRSTSRSASPWPMRGG